MILINFHLLAPLRRAERILDNHNGLMLRDILIEAILSEYWNLEKWEIQIIENKLTENQYSFYNGLIVDESRHDLRD